MGAPSLQAVPIIISQRGVNVITLTSVFLFLAGLTLFLRLYTQRVLRQSMIASDWMVVAAFVSELERWLTITQMLTVYKLFCCGHATTVLLSAS